MASIKAGAAERRERWKQLSETVSASQKHRNSGQAWLLASGLGLFLAVVLHIEIGILGAKPPNSISFTSSRLTKQMELTSDHAMGLLGLLATIVVALVFSRGTFDPTAVDSGAEAFQRIRLSTVAIGLGALAMAVGYLHASTLVMQSGDEPANWLMIVLVFGAASAITFVAVQTQPKSDELAVTASIEIPILKERHELLTEDQLERWGDGAEPTIVKSPWDVVIGIFIIFAFFTAAILVGLKQLAPAYSEPYTLWLQLMIVAVAMCWISSAIFWDTRWVGAYAGTALTAATGVVLTYAGTILWIATQQDMAGYGDSFEHLILSAVIVFPVTFGLLWPFMLARYPITPRRRKFVIIMSYPVHVARQRYLYSQCRARERVISIRKKQEFAHQKTAADASVNVSAPENSDPDFADNQNGCDQSLAEQRSGPFSILIPFLRSCLDRAENKMMKKN